MKGEEEEGRDLCVYVSDGGVVHLSSGQQQLQQHVNV